jgi:hypothetical protein
MHGFHRMQEEGTGAGAVEGGNNFMSDNPGLADATNDQAAFAPAYQINHADKLLIHPAGQLPDTIGFQVKDTDRFINYAFLLLVHQPYPDLPVFNTV